MRPGRTCKGRKISRKQHIFSSGEVGDISGATIFSRQPWYGQRQKHSLHEFDKSALSLFRNRVGGCSRPATCLFAVKFCCQKHKRSKFLIFWSAFLPFHLC